MKPNPLTCPNCHRELRYRETVSHDYEVDPDTGRAILGNEIKRTVHWSGHTCPCGYEKEQA